MVSFLEVYLRNFVMNFSCPHVLPITSNFYLTNSLEQSHSSEPSDHTQLLKKFLVFYGSRSSVPCLQEPRNGLYLNKMNLVHRLRHFNVIFPSMLRSFMTSLPFCFSNQNVLCISHLSHSCYMPCLFNPS
jgi:hypothetical protein